MSSRENMGLFWGFLGVVVFGLTLPATRHAAPWFDPVFIGLGRATLAATIALPLLVLTRQPLPTASQFRQLIIVALGIVVGFPVLSAWAMQSVPAAHGGVVLGILPLITALFGAWVSGERPSLGFWVFAALGSTLVVVFVFVENPDPTPTLVGGDLALLAAVVVAALAYALGGRLSRELGGWQVICWALVIALPFIVWPALWTFPDAPKLVPWEAWASFLYLGLFSQLIGFFWWNKGLAMGGIARVSQVQLLQTFVTLAAAWLLLGEPVSSLTLLFAAVIVMLVALGRRMQINPAPANPTP